MFVSKGNSYEMCGAGAKESSYIVCIYNNRHRYRENTAMNTGLLSLVGITECLHCLRLFFSLVKQCSLIAETSSGCYACAPMIHLHDFDCHVPCDLHSKSIRMVKIAQNPLGYRFYAGVVFKRYTPYYTQATPTQCQISDQYLSLENWCSYGSVIVKCIHCTQC